MTSCQHIICRCKGIEKKAFNTYLVWLKAENTCIKLVNGKN